MTELQRPELLDARHDRSAFRSGSLELDDWLHRYAGQNRRGNTAATWVVADADNRVVAYATLSNAAIDRSAAPNPLARSAPAQIPALRIGRLAVDQNYQRLGIGTAVVAHALGVAVALNRQSAAAAVTVNALDDHARRWWERLGFERIDPGNPDCRDLYLLTKDIEATLQRLA